MEQAAQEPWLGVLLSTGQGSDLALVCKDTTFKVHSAIICVQATNFGHIMREKATLADGSANGSKIIKMSEESATIRRVLQYLYTKSYSQDDVLRQDSPALPALPLPRNGHSSASSSRALRLAAPRKRIQAEAMAINMDVYLLAVKWGIDPLKQLAYEKYRNYIVEKGIQDDVVDVVDELEYAGNFVESVSMLYEYSHDTSPDEEDALVVMKDYILSTIWANAQPLYRSNGFTELFFEYPEFGCDLFELHAHEHREAAVDVKVEV